MLISGSKAYNVLAGLIIGRNNQHPVTCRFYGHIPRYLGDRSESIKWAKAILRDQKNSGN